MKLGKLFPVLTLGLFAVGCQDYDAGVTPDVFTQKKYADNFEKTFGKVDPQQDWSMAALVTANLNVGSGATAYVYTEKPGHRGSFLAGIVTDPSAQFNLVKGTEQVYVMVEQNNEYVVSGYFNVENGIIDIDNSPVEKKRLQTRSASGSFSVGTKLFTQTAYAKDADWDGKTYKVDDTHYFYIAKEGNEYYLYFSSTPDGTFRKLKHNADNPAYSIGGYHNNGKDAYYDDNSLALSNYYWPNLIEVNSAGELVIKESIAKYETRQTKNANYYLISGNTLSQDVEWTLGDCYNLFWGGDAVFHEGEHYNSEQHKLDAYAKYNTSVEELERGVLFTTSKDGAKIDIPMMFGATQNDNIFGYYYYEDDQDPLTVNRYVLYEDAQPSQNIKVDGRPVGDMDLQQIQSGWTKTSVATCTSRSLIYFGKDGNSAGSIEFPKDVKIGFFIMRQHKTSGSFDYSAYDVDATTRTLGETGWAYSDPVLNQKYVYDASGADAQTTWCKREISDTSKGNVKAITWMYDGRILCGFGDDSGDLDLNDFVWWVDGDVKETPKIRITSLSSSSWIVACEDLGGTFDYDFNDLVFALRKQQKRVDNTKAVLELVPLAAGGTLDARVEYDGAEKGEIHNLVKAGADTGTPLNVTAGTHPAAGTPILLADEIEWNADINAIITNNIKVKVIQKEGEAAVNSNYYINAYKKGENAVPQMIILPSGWDWPAENVPVDKVYAGFATWAADAKAVTWCYTKNGERASECVTDPLPDVEITTAYFEEPDNGQDVVGGDVQHNHWVLTIENIPDRLLLGNTQSLTVTMSPAGNYNAIQCSVDDPTILSATMGYQSITLKALKKGTAKLTLTFDDPSKFDYEESSVTYTIEVYEGTGETTSPFGCYGSNASWNVGMNKSFTELIYKTPYDAPYDTNRLIGTVLEGEDVVSVSGNSFLGLKPGTAKVRVTAPADNTYASASFDINVTITKKTLQINAGEFMVLKGETATNIFSIPEDYNGTITGTSSLGTLTGTSFTAGNTPGSGSIQLACTETDLYTAGNCGTINVKVYNEKVENTITSDFGNIAGSVFEGAIKVVFKLSSETNAQKTYYKFHTENGWAHDWEFNDIWNDIEVSGGDLTYLIQNGLTLVTSDGLTSLTYTIYK